ncbi:hypothetical protein NE237_001918 [Protea cynaroides]|uniref:Uncharacterized protein n=1 Tax=Protea cynaroides TaxID=273540 RepID=A0A9Q0QYU6_9MAGN|nr:hypothetical protein NE237_001918 [Protea cynaroides]
MTQMGLLWWQKQTTAANCGGEGGEGAGAASTPTTPMTPAGSTSRRQNSGCCLMRLVKKLKKHSRMLCATTVNSRPNNTFHCRYDPWSYALNFDTSGCGGMLDDDNYHHLLAFSSRFAATPPINGPPRLLAVATSH